ncbi:hypothetical protein MBLNU457_6167t1 [Dothideomycetes sp. NU457]
MHISSFVLLALPALALTQNTMTLPSEVLATPVPAQALLIEQSQPTQTPSTFSTSVIPSTTNSLDRRQAPADVVATTQVQQVNPVTTEWPATVLPNGQTTWLPVVFTQHFSSVPDQLPSAASGSIGMGTVTGVTGAVKTGKAASGAAASVAAGSGVKVLAVAAAGVALLLC